MKKIRLSSPAERKTAWGLAVFLFLLIALILFSLRRGLGYFLLLCLCSLLAIALVAAYLSAVIKAAVEIEGESRLKICGLVSSTVDCSGAVSVKTSPVTIGPIQSRAILLCDSQGQTVCSISTMFTANEGVMAEPAAIELAKLLDLDFVKTVEEWKYDPEAMALHTEQLRKERKARRRHRRNGDSPDENNIHTAPKDGVNYDAMDDER